MSFTGTAGTGGYMALEPKQTCHIFNLRNQVALEEDSDLFAEDKSYSASFHLLGLANDCLALWLFLVASSYFLLSKNLNFFGTCRSKTAEEVSLTVRTISDARTENDATALNSKFSCSDSSGSSLKCDAYSEISDLDRTSYLDSLLSLEDEDTEWLSDSMLYDECSSEDPSTPLSYKCDSLSEISDIGSPSYWDSLLRLEEKDSDKESYFDSLLSLEDEDNDWLSDSFENPSTPLSYKCDSLSEISDIGSPSYWDSLLRLEEKDSDKENYFDSLLSLEDEDNDWLSDSFENPSTPLSCKCDSLSEISDIGSPSYWSSLLKLEENDNEWISDSTQKMNYVLDGSPNKSEDSVSAATEELSTDEPLFWPFEEEHNWNSEESWSSFCSSPRRKLVFESTSPTPKIKECKQKGNDALCSVNSETSRLSMWSKSSAKIVVPLECEDDLSNTFLNENFASNNDHPIETLLGLKEFDGHEGLDSEFNIGDVFMLD